jgi:hypothetical protein
LRKLQFAFGLEAAERPGLRLGVLGSGEGGRMYYQPGRR